MSKEILLTLMAVLIPYTCLSYPDNFLWLKRAGGLAFLTLNIFAGFGAAIAYVELGTPSANIVAYSWLGFALIMLLLATIPRQGANLRYVFKRILQGLEYDSKQYLSERELQYRGLKVVDGKYAPIKDSDNS